MTNDGGNNDGNCPVNGNGTARSSCRRPKPVKTFGEYGVLADVWPALSMTATVGRTLLGLPEDRKIK